MLSLYKHSAVRMGAPANMTADETEYLRRISVPQMESVSPTPDGSYSENLLLPPHGIVLLTPDRLWG